MGAIPVAVTGALCLLIAAHTALYGDRAYTRSDWVCLSAAAIGVLMWPLAGPVSSLLIVMVVDLLGFGPTITKAWREPRSEPARLWALNSAKHLLTIGALTHVAFLTAAYPIMLISANGAFTVMLLVRRRQREGELVNENSRRDNPGT